MKHDEELVERVAKAMAEAEGYEVPQTEHYTLSAEALRVLAPELRHDPPKGCDWVALPTEYVDQVVAMPEAWSLTLADACRATVARRPKPEPRTERVPCWEAVRDGREVIGASSPFTAHYIWRSGPDRAFCGERTMDKAVLIAPDGTVEVLAEDDQ